MKKLILTSFISVLAYVSILFIKFPISFLDLEVKDFIIALGGILLGVVPSLIMSFLTALLELITVSSSGFVGFFMNVTSTIFYVLPIVLVYKNTKKTLIIGILLGTNSMTTIMVLFNILITPKFYGYSLDEVLALLPALIIPFNILKGILNGILILLIVNPIKSAFKRANLI